MLLNPFFLSVAFCVSVDFASLLACAVGFTWFSVVSNSCFAALIPAWLVAASIAFFALSRASSTFLIAAFFSSSVRCGMLLNPFFLSVAFWRRACFGNSFPIGFTPLILSNPRLKASSTSIKLLALSISRFASRA